VNRWTKGDRDNRDLDTRCCGTTGHVTEAEQQRGSSEGLSRVLFGKLTSAKIGGGDRRGWIELATAEFRRDVLLGITMS